MLSSAHAVTAVHGNSQQLWLSVRHKVKPINLLRLLWHAPPSPRDQRQSMTAGGQGILSF